MSLRGWLLAIPLSAAGLIAIGYGVKEVFNSETDGTDLIKEKTADQRFISGTLKSLGRMGQQALEELPDADTVIEYGRKGVNYGTEVAGKVGSELASTWNTFSIPNGCNPPQSGTCTINGVTATESWVHTNKICFPRGEDTPDVREKLGVSLYDYGDTCYDSDTETWKLTY